MTDNLVQAIKQLHESVHDPRAFQKCCDEISSIIASPKDSETNGLNLTAVTTDPVIASMTEAMERFPEDEQVQESVCHFVSVRSLKHPNKRLASQDSFNREIRALLAAMERFPNSFKIQVYGTECLANLNITDRNRIEIVKHGGVKALVHVVDTFGDNPDCIRFGIGCIARVHLIRLKDPVVYRDNFEYFKQGIERVPDLLVMHSKNGMVMTQLMLALHNMKGVLDWNLIEQKHIAALLATMNESPDDIEIQRFAILSLITVTRHERLVDMLIDLGGIKPIVHTLYAFKDPTLAMDNAIKALFTISTTSRKGAEAVATEESGAIEAILHCMKKYFVLALVQSRCCEFLMSVTRTIAGRKAVAEKGGVPLLLDTLREYHDCGQVQINGMQALANLFTIEDVRKKYYDGRLEDLITQKLSKYANNPDVKRSIRIIKREATKEAIDAASVGVCSTEVCDDPAYQWMYVRKKGGEKDVFICPACWEYNRDAFEDEDMFVYDMCSCKDSRCKQVIIATIA